MIRGAVVGLINNKSLNQRSNGYDDSRAVTLMSTDAHSVGQTASMIHDTLAQILEVVIGMTMLARQVGLVVLVPLFMIICKLLSTRSSTEAKHHQSLLQNKPISSERP